MADINIENIVVSAKIAKSLDIDMLAVSIPNSKYNANENPALIVHFQEPTTVAMLFSNGKAIFTGLKNMKQIDEISKKLFDKLNALGIKLYKKPNIKVQNVVGSLDLKRELDLNALAQLWWLEDIEYEPERFLGLVYKMKNPNATILIFNSGKIVCTATRLKDMSTAIDKTTDMIPSVGM